MSAPAPIPPHPSRPPRARRHRPSAFATDVRRTITGNLRRFLSLFVICALGASMLVGLTAACADLRASADSFYDAQGLFDVSVQSTLGLTDDDIAALAALDGVDVAEGGYAETASTEVEGSRGDVDVKALSEKGLNEPLVLEGRLPRRADEVAVTQKYAEASGKGVGDTVTFTSSGGDGGTGTGEGAAGADASSGAVFRRGDYTVTAVVLDPMDVNAGNKTMSFRSSSGSPYAFFVTRAAVADPGVYTVAYLSVSGTRELATYSEAYRERVAAVKDGAEAICAEREAARTAEVRDAATAEIDDAQAEADAELADGEAQLADGRAEVEASAAELAAGEARLADGRAQLDAAERDAAAEIAASRDEVARQRTELADGAAQLDAAAAQAVASLGDTGLSAAWSAIGSAGTADAAQTAAGTFASRAAAAIDAQVDARVDAAVTAALEQQLAEPRVQLAQLDAAAGELERQIAALDPADPEAGAQQAALERQLAAVTAQRDAVRAGIAQAEAAAAAQADAQKAEQRAAQQGAKDQLAQLADKRAQTVAGAVQLDAAASRLDAAEREAADEIAARRSQLASSEAQLADGAAQLDAARAELDEGAAELAGARAEAERQIADARADVAAIEDATWYIQDRTANSSYSTVDSDASSIEGIATVFPVIFFVVAVLIGLTTVTRMVEEDRGLIGLYKALGYSRRRILSKYLVYALAACLAGGLAGDLIGFVVLPEVLFTIFSTMYALPAFSLGFDALSAVAGIALFAVGIVGAALAACRLVLRETPASLMRPKAPAAGKRILLERVRPLWRRLSFLDKVSARNLFRYKKRFLMTAFGIAGCTALLICGLGIRDTVYSLKPRQYGDGGVVSYDLLAVAATGDARAAREALTGSGMVDEMLSLRIDSVTASFGGAQETVQIMVVPDGADLADYIATDGEDGEHLSLPERGNGVLITKNAEQVLGFKVGDELSLQDSRLRTGTVRVDGVTVNYLGNFVFMTEDAYRDAFGTACEQNAFLANLTGTDAQKIALADELASDARFSSISSSTKIAEDFSTSFKIIDVVVYVVTVMAAALSFAVVFTLSTTNISERERELATIKVLGFRRREVHRYINRETVVLTLIGIAAGWPMGYGITRLLTYVLRMPSLYFDTIVEPQTYVIASVMSLAFTLIVNRLTDRSLDRIDMVGALKSAE